MKYLLILFAIIIIASCQESNKSKWLRLHKLERLRDSLGNIQIDLMNLRFKQTDSLSIIRSNNHAYADDALYKAIEKRIDLTKLKDANIYYRWDSASKAIIKLDEELANRYNK